MLNLFHRRHRMKPAAATDGRDVLLTIDETELLRLDATFAPPRWLRDLGRSAWLVVGVFLVVGGLVWLLATTALIVGPLVVAAIVATVAMPVVTAFARHMPRALAAVSVLLIAAALAVTIVILVIAGITGQHDQLAQLADQGVAKVQSWLSSLGVDSSGLESAKSSLESDVAKILSTLLTGVISGIRGITSVVFGLSLGALSLFFLLKDGPTLRAWVDRHLGVPHVVAHTITSGVIRSLRGYFRGVTIIATFNGVVVGLGALLLGVPLAGTIAVVTFVTAYIPFIGAFAAGTLAVVVALGAKGTTTALIMLGIVILANGLLQNLVQPFAMGAALGLNPLVVLVVTIGAGCIFGTLGLILAAPITSAAVHITRDLTRGRAEAAARLAAQAAATSGAG
jgi:predicted PurR-regulated permease PerM